MKTDRQYIGVLDGFRAFSILSIMFFHFWQQSWLGGFHVTIFGKSLEIMPREFFCSGSAWVDLLLLLTAFLMFLPYAREMAGEKVILDKPLHFYRKRFARLAPSAYFHIAILAIFVVRVSDYGGNVWQYVEDLVRNLLFMQNSPYPHYVYSKYTGTLWTLTVEVAFYLLFPFIARVFKKYPLPTFAVMVGVGEAFINLYAIPQINKGNWLPHRMFLSYMGVFGVGMLAATIYAEIQAGTLKDKKWFAWVCTAVGVVSSIAGIRLIWFGYGRDTTQIWQVENRLLFATITAVAIISVAFSVKGLRVIYSNPVTHFIATISYNMYIWHQFFSVYLKKWKIPFYPEKPADVTAAWPQGGDFAGHTAWQWKYTLILWTATIVVATLTTFLIEKPLAKLIMKKRNTK